MKKLLKYDLGIMLHKKEFAISFCVMMVFAVFALYQGICYITMWGDNCWYDINIVGAEWMSAIFEFLTSWQVFTYLFAFLVVLPYSMSYFTEFESGMLPVLLSRTSKFKYCLSKMITCFIGNVLIIMIPLLVNYLLCRLAFGSKPNAGMIGEYKLANYNNQLTGESAMATLKYPVIPMINLLMNHRSLYLLIRIGLISFASGIFGVFLVCLSFVIKKYRALLFLPVFLLIRVSSAVSTYFLQLAINDSSYEYVEYSFINYFPMGASMSLSPYYLPFIFGGILLFCGIVMTVAVNTDRLLLGEVKLRDKNRKKTSA